jgi:hypothetical protein
VLLPAVLLLATTAACQSSSGPNAHGRLLTAQAPAPAPSTADEFLTVDCVLPPRFRATGRMLVPARPLKTSRADCRARGGEAMAALKVWMQQAKDGDAKAQTYVADEFAKEDDCVRAVDWYSRAVKGGDDGAARVGLWYMQQRGCRVPPELLALPELDPPSAPAPGLPRVDFGAYHALVIGNAGYQYLRRLETSVNDARRVSDLLRTKYGFTVKLLTDATRHQLLETLEDLRRKLTERDNLLIYYAGHGVLDEKNARGYWQPVDATRDSRTQWVSTVAVADILNTTAAKRILIVADSCYAGAWLRSVPSNLGPDDDASWIEAKARWRARLVLASGNLEPVLDRGGGEHSVFAKHFIQALEDHHRRGGVLSAQALYGLVGPRVYAAVAQEPVYAPMQFAGHVPGGEFFFQPVTSK